VETGRAVVAETGGTVTPRVGVGGRGVLVGVGGMVGVSVGLAMAVLVKSDSTVCATLVIISSGLVVGSLDLQAARMSSKLRQANMMLMFRTFFFIISPLCPRCIATST
jgi:hypothetical protein